jgi:hypothetical protein
MSAESTSAKEMGVVGRIVGIYTSPRETFESIDKRPTWLVPFVIVILFVLAMTFLTMDIGIKDRQDMMEARGMTEQQLEQAHVQSQGWMKYLSVVLVPVATLIVFLAISGLLTFGGNTIMGGSTKFKKVFSVVAWSSMVSVISVILRTFLILKKGTSLGIQTSLAILLETPELGQSPTLLNRFLSRFEIFTIWEMILWIIGLSVIYKFTIKKSATLVISLWIIWIIIAVVLGSLVGKLFGG